MMMFGVEKLGLPFNSDEFWELPLPLFIGAVEFEDAKLEARLEEQRKLERKFPSR